MPMKIPAACLVVFTVSAFLVPAGGAWAGEGGAGGRQAILIHDVYELQNISLDLNASYALANDIDASATKNWNLGKGFQPLGTTADEFTGTLDGKGHNITGLYINRPDEDHIGLIRMAHRASGFIRNICLIDVDITGGYKVGGHRGQQYHALALVPRDRHGRRLGKLRWPGRLKRIYPAEMRPEEAPPRVGRLERIIFEAVREREGMSQHEIARALDVPYPTVSGYVNQVARGGVFRPEKSRINVRCYLAMDGRAGKNR